MVSGALTLPLSCPMEGVNLKFIVQCSEVHRLSMHILGIENRTENWKTAVYFSPLFLGNSNRLADRLGATPLLPSDDVTLELFWKGMRDHLYKRGIKKRFAKQALVDRYNRMFPSLRRDIEKFGELRLPNSQNYDASTDDWMDELVDNLVNTEIDVVLETPKHLLVGEAKHEARFGANGSYVLVHQLIRQYVMANILVDFLPNKVEKEVIPFVIGDDVEYLNRTAQVQFMIDQGWMKKENVLCWDEIPSWY